jgi:ABC-type transporter Mla maintaining outer membrane lipid asymmetry ATPase subunit MlaF
MLGTSGTGRSVFLETLVGLEQRYLGKESWTWLLIGPLAG